MMGVIVGCFAVCWFPFSIMFILFPTSETALDFFDKNPAVIDWITWLGLFVKYFSHSEKNISRLLQLKFESNNLCSDEPWNQESDCSVLQEGII